MGTHLFQRPTEPPHSRAALLGSATVHGVLLLGLGYLSWTTLGRGTHREPRAESNIVLGLSDGLGDSAPNAAGPAALPLSEFGDASPRDAVALDAAPQAVLTADVGVAEPITPPPQLPMFALGGREPAARAPGPSAPARSGGAVRLGRVAERATVTVFGAVGEGSRFVYVFDHSTSMTGSPLAAAKQQLIASLDELSSVHQFQVIFFNHEMQAWDLTGGQGRVPYASDRNKRLAEQFIRGVAATGATERLTPLLHALAMQPDVVFFLTDADDAMPSYDLAEVVERAQRRGTAIACIEFGVGPQDDGGNFLTQLASATGGDYVYVDASQLDDFLKR